MGQLYNIYHNEILADILGLLWDSSTSCIIKSLVTYDERLLNYLWDSQVDMYIIKNWTL